MGAQDWTGNGVGKSGTLDTGRDYKPPKLNPRYEPDDRPRVSLASTPTQAAPTIAAHRPTEAVPAPVQTQRPIGESAPKLLAQHPGGLDTEVMADALKIDDAGRAGFSRRLVEMAKAGEICRRQGRWYHPDHAPAKPAPQPPQHKQEPTPVTEIQIPAALPVGINPASNQARVWAILHASPVPISVAEIHRQAGGVAKGSVSSAVSRMLQRGELACERRTDCLSNLYRVATPAEMAKHGPQPRLAIAGGAAGDALSEIDAAIGRPLDRHADAVELLRGLSDRLASRGAAHASAELARVAVWIAALHQGGH